jgi:hypothetical protein
MLPLANYEPNILLNNEIVRCIAVEPGPKSSIDYTQFKEYKTFYCVPIKENNKEIGYKFYAPINNR